MDDLKTLDSLIHSFIYQNNRDDFQVSVERAHQVFLTTYIFSIEHYAMLCQFFCANFFKKCSEMF